jgi:hypothetical protein
MKKFILALIVTAFVLPFMVVADGEVYPARLYITPAGSEYNCVLDFRTDLIYGRITKADPAATTLQCKVWGKMVLTVVDTNEVVNDKKVITPQPDDVSDLE